MRGERVDISRPIERERFKIIQLPGRIVTRRRQQRRAAHVAGSADGHQAEGMTLFIFHHQKTPVRELLNGGWLIQAGQGLKHGMPS